MYVFLHIVNFQNPDQIVGINQFPYATLFVKVSGFPIADCIIFISVASRNFLNKFSHLIRNPFMTCGMFNSLRQQIDNMHGFE